MTNSPSQITIDTRRRAMGRRFQQVGTGIAGVAELDLVVGLEADVVFLDKKEEAALKKITAALATVSKNLQVLGKRLDK
jgi:hypothetical protein